MRVGAPIPLKSTTGEAATTPEAGIGRIHAELPVGRPELGKLARWIPTKEMALLFEIFDRAGSDPGSDEAGFAALFGLRREGCANAGLGPVPHCHQ
jgi:hypothetical protein